MFNIDFYDIPYYVSVHLVRHIHAQPFVSTSRPDIDGNMQPREEQKKTRGIWQQVINLLYEQEPILATACVPNCIYRGMCPELRSCGFIDSQGYDLAREEYCNVLM